MLPEKENCSPLNSLSEENSSPNFQHVMEENKRLKNTVKVLEDRLKDAEKRLREQYEDLVDKLERVSAQTEHLQLHSSLTENGQAIWKIKDFKASLVALENMVMS